MIVREILDGFEASKKRFSPLSERQSNDRVRVIYFKINLVILEDFYV
jgi:hypothetical protein